MKKELAEGIGAVIGDLDAVLDELVQTCTCPACHRYRQAMASRLAYWTVKLEESIGRVKQK